MCFRTAKCIFSSLMKNDLLTGVGEQIPKCMVSADDFAQIGESHLTPCDYSLGLCKGRSLCPSMPQDIDQSTQALILPAAGSGADRLLPGSLILS